MWKKLLVPHDFSPCAARALRTAAELAKVHGAQLELVHVAALPASLPPETMISPTAGARPLRVSEYATRGALQQLEFIAEPLRHQGLIVHTFATTGDVAAQVLQHAQAVRADALVVGTHGRKGLSHFFLGSVAEKLVRRATVPVVCVRSQTAEARSTHEELEADDELPG